MKRKLLFGLSALLCACLLAGCGDSQPSAATTVLGTEDSTDTQQTLVSQEDLAPRRTTAKSPDTSWKCPRKGRKSRSSPWRRGEVFKLRFFPDEAPKAVYNFKVHALEGYYDGLTFHRVIENFMIQGGDPRVTAPAGKASGASRLKMNSTTTC